MVAQTNFYKKAHRNTNFSFVYVRLIALYIKLIF